jgi:hypothetical protein
MQRKGYPMTAMEELLGHVRETRSPEKGRILETRRLAQALASTIPDRSLARRLVRDFNMSYLNLQFATLADNPDLAVKCRKDCIALVAEMETAGGGVEVSVHAGYDGDHYGNTTEKPC